MSRQTIDPHRRRQCADARPLTGVTLALALATAPAVLAHELDPPALPSLQDCDSAEMSRVVRASNFDDGWDAVRKARAVWIDGRRLLWPGQPVSGEYRI